MKKVKHGIICTVLFLLAACSGTAAPTLKEKSVTLEYGQNPYIDIQLENLLENYDDVKEQYQFSLSLFNADEEEIKEDSITDDALLQVGEYTLSIDYADDEAPLQLSVTIKDTVAPEFKDFKEKVSVDYGYDKDLTKLFSAEDLADVAIRIDGAVDTKKAGDYKVTVIAEDTSGNQTESECTITVKEKAADRSSSENAATSAKVIGSDGSDPSKESADPPSSDVGSEPLDHDQAKCVILEDQIGNTGKILTTQEEAIAWAENHIRADDAGGDGNITSYSYGGVHDSCGNLIGYTVGFTYEGWQLPAF